MALKGNINWMHVEVSETETEEITLTHPDGTQEVFENPKTVYRYQEYTDVYIYIRSIQTHTMTIEGVKTEQLHFHISGHTSKEARDADNDDFLFFENHTVVEYDHNDNLWQTCYNALKQNETYKDLEDC